MLPSILRREAASGRPIIIAAVFTVTNARDIKPVPKVYSQQNIEVVEVIVLALRRAT